MLQHAWWSIFNTMLHAVLFAAAIIIPGGFLVYLGWRAYKSRQRVSSPIDTQKERKTSLLSAQTAFKKMFPKDSLRAENRLRRLAQLRKMRPKK